ncbi:uncharacterized protein LOC112574654 isoform X3 [Pomacea canaliculata]|uniref:uncharacterized protein LOC112574654 isoform X3 n=1 Tax=Pomacea canaliculata TaxID=400727 RepID=UPI000D73289C|nr:uncharacterized protein LOC112574654 isoform X3 [Pomacea canaliculata]
MSYPSWDPTGFQQQGGAGGGEGQPQVGGIKMFDPSQFQSQQGVAMDHIQNQTHWSAWDNWGTWNWNSENQNGIQSGHPDDGQTTSTSNGVKEHTAQNGNHYQLHQQQQQFQPAPQYASHFYNPQQFQTTEGLADTSQVTSHQQPPNAQQQQQQVQYDAAYNYHWGVQQWALPVASHVSPQTVDGQALGQHTHQTMDDQAVPPPGQYVHQTKDSQAVVTSDQYGHQTIDRQTVPASGQYNHQEQYAQAYFNPSVWQNNPDHDLSQACNWGSNFEPGLQDMSSPETEKTAFQGKAAGMIQNTQDQVHQHFGKHSFPGTAQASLHGGEDARASTQHQNLPITVEPEDPAPGPAHHSNIGSDVGSVVAMSAFTGLETFQGKDATHIESVEMPETVPTMHHLKVSAFARTDSGISNASLQTVNLSADEDAENGVEEMGKRMAALCVSSPGSGDAANIGGSGPKSGGSRSNSTDLLDMRNSGTDWTSADVAQTSQNIAASSSEGHMSLVNDWNTAPQAHSSASHSRNSSLDDGITFTAKPLEQNTAGYQPRMFASETTLSSQNGAPRAVYSPSIQESESFTAISSTSGSVDALLSQGSDPVTSSTPYTSPGGHSLASQPPPQVSQPGSPACSGLSLEQVSPPSILSLPSSSSNEQQTEKQAKSPDTSAVSLNQQTLVPAEALQPTINRSLEGTSFVGKPLDSSVMRSPNAGSSPAWRPPPAPRPRGDQQSSPEKELVSLSSPQRRTHQSAFQPVHSHRGKHNMSPATTLWDNLDSNPTSNILLAPAAPLIIPSLNASALTNTITATTTAVTAMPLSSASMPRKASSDSLLERQSVGKNGERKASERGSSSRSNIRRLVERKDGERNTGNRGQSEDLSRSREDDSRSLGSLDELDGAPEFDDSRDRNKGYARDPRYDPYYDRPSSRVDNYRDDYRRQKEAYHGYGRDYRDPYYDERYDRPRSRQDEERSSRPSSRMVREPDRPKSRSEYDRDRDIYYQHQRDYRYRAYPGYENYPQDYYYDERDRYYRYYTDSRYRRGYAEEMGYYGQPYDRYADAYYGHPPPPLQPPPLPNQVDDVDQASLASHSRGQTPALDDGDVSQDYYRKLSRPSSQIEREPDVYRQGYGTYGAYEPYAGYYDPYHYGYYTDQQYVSQTGYQEGRMTPPKYLLPHMRTCFGPNGQLVIVQPNRPTEGQPAVVEIHEVTTILQNDPEMEELKDFLGPLVRNQTHKNDVLLLCQKRAKECAENINMVDRESAELIWRFLELLLKQNGSIIGTDIADLLLAGHEPSTHEYAMSGMRIIPSADQLDVTDGDEDSRTSSPSVRLSADRSIIAADRSIITATQQLEEATDRFRHYLLYGHKKEALDWAMKHNLWGHALFLASKMDTRTHANVMTRFANTAMRMNDPLQTLYQLMSGRQPASVTNMVDERWGDWRPHLAMILSNHSNRPELVKKSVVTLGDTLATKHCLHASHFCYLMAEVDFGSFLKKTSKLVLIGSNHNLQLGEFASNAAIQCTEVYEYAQSLGNARFTLPQFQVYKFLYACRLAEYGLAQEAFNYCEVIAQQVLLCPARYHPAFIASLQSVASQLKHCDPRRLHEDLDSPDPEWLTNLWGVCQSYEDGSIQFKSGTATPMTGYGGVTPSSESGEIASYVRDSNNTSMGGLYQQDPSTYTSYQQPPQTAGSGTAHGGWLQSQQQQGLGVDQFGQYSAMYSQQQAATGEQYSQQQQQAVCDANQQYHLAQQQQYDSSQYQQQQWQNYDYNTQAYTSSAPVASAVHQVQGAAGEQQLPQHQPLSTGQGSFEPQAGQGYHAAQRGSIASTSGSLPDNVEEDEEDEEEVVEEASSAGGSHFDYFGAASQQIVPPPHRYRTTSTSSTSSTGRIRHRNPSESSTSSIRAAPSAGKPAASTVKPPEPKKDSGNNQKTDGSGRWFGGLFSKFGRRDKNEMILPDDKNPSIVWDPVKKAWVNKDGDSNEEQSAAPPPKAADLISKAANPNTSAPVMNGPPSGNMFSLGRGKGARGQYVDVLNPAGRGSTSAVPSNLFNVLPASGPATTTASTTAPNVPMLFNPSGAANASSQFEDASRSLQTPLSNELSCSSSLSSLSHEIQQLAIKAQELGDADMPKPAMPGAGQPSGMPVMFDPAQLSQSSGPTTSNTNTGGSGLKYGHRRVYPK